MTPSEKLVFDLCTRSCLSLWSYASPQRPDGRELCDTLVVFQNHIVIFSVKGVALKSTPDPAVGASRWTRRAVDESVGQLAGAQRELRTMTQVIRQDKALGIALPSVEARKVHLVAVAAGAERTVPFAGGQLEPGSVHVMDEFALRIILGELDTAPDFMHYLEAKESFRGSIVCEGEENLLAFYLHRGRALPTEIELLVADDTLWPGVSAKPEFVARKDQDRASYWWDRVLETLIGDLVTTAGEVPLPTEHELVVRTMAAENRFARRVLSAACLDWLMKRQAGARNLVSPSGVAYVFATYPRDYGREHRQADLGMRCFVARGTPALAREITIGIATELYDPSGYSLDVVYLWKPEWEEEDTRVANDARRQFGVLKDPILRAASTDEFPSPPQTTPHQSRRDRRRQKRGTR